MVEQGIYNPQILILTYNITLKNFIHDKIQQVQEEFDWKSFTILNYHQFINAQLNNLGIDFRCNDNESDEDFFARYYDNYQLFADYKDMTERFDVIFIDEIQDYKRVWMDIVKDCFLCSSGDYPRGGYYLFGDVKQNIYNRGISGKDVVTNVLGVNTLETCFRSDMKIKDLALDLLLQYGFPIPTHAESTTIQCAVTYYDMKFAIFESSDTRADGGSSQRVVKGKPLTIPLIYSYLRN